MAPPLNLDPAAIYLKYPKMADFLIFWVLFYFLVRMGLSGASHAKRKGLGHLIHAVATGESEHSRRDAALATFISLALTISLMAFSKLSLKSLFDSGMLPLFVGAILGVVAYNAVEGRFKEETWWIPVAIGLTVGGIIFSLVSGKGIQQDWKDVLFWGVTILIIVASLLRKKKTTSTEQETARDTAQTNSDVAAANQQNAALAGEVANLKKQLETAGKTAGVADKSVAAQLSGLNKRQASLSKLQMFKTAVMSALLFATQSLLPASSWAQVEQGLKKQGFDDKVVASVVSKLKKEHSLTAKEPAVAPAPVIELSEADIVKGAPEVVELAPALYGEISSNIAQSDSLIKGIQSALESRRKIIASWKSTKVPEDSLRGNVRKISDDALKFEGDVKKSTQAPALLGEAESVSQEVAAVSAEVESEIKAFEDGMENEFNLLEADMAESHMTGILSALQDVLKKFVAFAAQVKPGKEGGYMLKIPPEQMGAWFAEYERVLVLFKNALAKAKEIVEAAKSVIPGTESILSKHRSYLEEFAKRIAGVTSKLQELQKRFGDAQRVVVAEKKAEVGVVDKLPDLIKTLEDLRAMVIKVEGIDASNIDMQKNFELVQMSAQFSGSILPDLSEEKRMALEARDLPGMDDLIGIVDKYFKPLSDMQTYLARLIQYFQKKDVKNLPNALVNFKAKEYGDILQSLIGDLKFVVKKMT